MKTHSNGALTSIRIDEILAKNSTTLEKIAARYMTARNFFGRRTKDYNGKYKNDSSQAVNRAVRFYSKRLGISFHESMMLCATVCAKAPPMPRA